jgi:hypothetical protein
MVVSVVLLSTSAYFKGSVSRVYNENSQNYEQDVLLSEESSVDLEFGDYGAYGIGALFVTEKNGHESPIPNHEDRAGGHVSLPPGTSVCTADFGTEGWAELIFADHEYEATDVDMISTFYIYKDGQLAETFTYDDVKSWGSFLECDATYSFEFERKIDGQVVSTDFKGPYKLVSP